MGSQRLPIVVGIHLTPETTEMTFDGEYRFTVIGVVCTSFVLKVPCIECQYAIYSVRTHHLQIKDS